MILSIENIHGRFAHLILRVLAWLVLVGICQPFVLNTAPRCRLVHEVHASSPPLDSKYSHDELKLNGYNQHQEQQLIQGYITKRRLMGSSLAFLAVQVDGDDCDSTPLVLRREYYKSEDIEFAVACKILQPGVVARFMGYFVDNRQEEQFVVTTVEYSRPNNNPQHLCNILKLIQDDKLNCSMLANALNVTGSQLLDRIVHAQQTVSAENPMYHLAKELLSNTSGLLDPFQFIGSTTKAKVSLLPFAPQEYATVVDSFSQNNQGMGGVSATLTGQIQSRIRYKESITQVTLAVTAYNELGNHTLTRCILHPLLMKGNATMYGNICSKGARVTFQGFWRKINNDMLFWVNETPQIMRASSNLGSVQYLMELIHQGHVDPETASRALQTPINIVENILDTPEPTKRIWKAAEIARDLQLGEERDERLGQKATHHVLDKYTSLRENYPLVESQHDHTNEPLALSLFETSKLAATGSRWNRAKRPQLEWMLQQIRGIIESNPKYGREPIVIVDVGGGRGYLATLIAEVFGNLVTVSVIDISSAAVKNGMMRSRKRSVENIAYQVSDATSVHLGKVDMIVALHACGVLTDVALGHAVSSGASFVVCPCCYLSNRHLRIPLVDYRLSSVEWLDVPPSDLENLLQLAELQGCPRMSTTAAHTINALRATACSQRSFSMSGSFEIHLKSFPIGYSLRNIGIIGQARY